MERSLQPDKLIRDKVPRIMLAKGQQPVTRFAGGDEYRAMLREKLAEESAEACAAGDEDLLEELADVLEVVHALAESVGSSPDELAQRREAKRAERGGFAAGIVWEDDGSPSSAPGVKHVVTTR
jgi:predicted house-cleaning noncanonical NTP pyrophosphatase (MazG superfamily)